MTTTAKPTVTQTTGNAPDASSGAENLNGGTRQPGNLQGTATLVIQTRQAQRLLTGRPKSGEKARIVGLYHFSGKMRTIWMASCQDDPYADWYLVQVEDNIKETRLELTRLQQHVLASLQSIPGIEVKVARSTSPVRVPLRFGTPYGYMGAYLISEFDQLMSAILTAEHVGLLTRDSGQQLTARGSRLIKRSFAIPLSWKPLAVTREDVQQNTQLAQLAREQMGEIPEDILVGIRRARVPPVVS